MNKNFILLGCSTIISIGLMTIGFGLHSIGNGMRTAPKSAQPNPPSIIIPDNISINIPDNISINIGNTKELAEILQTSKNDAKLINLNSGTVIFYSAELGLFSIKDVQVGNPVVRKLGSPFF